MRSLTPIALVLFVLSTLAVLSPPAVAAADPEDGKERTWGYRGEAGKVAPADWPGECRTGTTQSPIDLARSAMTGQPAARIEFKYQKAASLVVDTGHDVEVKEVRGAITVDGTPYTLCRFHFHTPSEHTVDNVGAAAEVHFVHQQRCGTGPAVAVGALIEPASAPGDASATLSRYLEDLENLPRRTPELDPSGILPADGYRQYDGSLTTPSCGGPVTWFLARDPLRLSTKDLDALRARYPDNARPVQSRGTRTIRGPR